MMEDDVYVKTVSVRLTEKQSERLEKLAKERGQVTSDFLRHIICSYRKNKEEYLEDIEFHKYKIKECNIRIKEQEEEEKEGKKGAIAVRQEKRAKEQEKAEINNLIKPVFTEAMEKYKTLFFGQQEWGEEHEAAKKDIIKIMQKGYKNLPEKLKKKGLKSLVELINRYFFKIEESSLKGDV